MALKIVVVKSVDGEFEKAIVGEWHEFTLLLARMERVRNLAESGGTPRKAPGGVAK